MQAEPDNEKVAFTRPSTGDPILLPDKFKGSTKRPDAKPSLRDVYPQVIASCFAHLLVVQAGINMAYSAILLPQLMAPDSELRINTDQGSWIASLVAISTPVGALVCGPLMDMFGRKLFSIMAAVPIAVSWFIVAFTPNIVWPLYVARVLAGFGGGLTTVSLVYISEVSDASWRPMLLCLNSVFVSLGILLTNLLGVYLTWRVVALSAGCFTILSAVAIAAYNPESPYWLLTFRPNSDTAFERAKQSMTQLYPNNEMFAKEWDRLTAINKRRHHDEQNSASKSNAQRTLSELLKRTSLLPLSLLLTIFMIQQLSGTYPIIFYAVQVFQSIGANVELDFSADSAAVLLGIIRFGTSLLTAGLSRSCGRRQLMLFSTVGMTLTAFVGAVYLQKACTFVNVFEIKNVTVLINNSSNNVNITSVDKLSGDNSGLVGAVIILVFVFLSSIGILIIPWTLVGEILPLTVRGTVGGFLFAFAYLVMFFIVKLFPIIIGIIHISGMFYFFSFVSVVGALVVYLFLPETLGKSFDEIEQCFSKSTDKT